jgi:SulP family sulfate permease
MAIEPLSELNQITDEVAALSSNMFKLRFPFISELKTYSISKFKSDLIAATTLTLISIPQAIGFSLILNLPPAPVIAAVIIGGFIGSLFFSSRHHVFGPTSSISLIVAATISSYTNSTGLAPLQLAIYLGAMIGFIQLMAGLLNFGEITKFISRSVVVGYGTGIGVLLLASQLHNIIGYSADPHERFITDVWRALESIRNVRVEYPSLLIGAITFFIFMIVKRIKPNWPEALIGLTTLALGSFFYAHLPQIFPHANFTSTLPFRLIRDEGALTAVIPAFAGFHFETHNSKLFTQLAGTAVAIAILGMLEAASITKGLAARSGQRIEPNQELIGMGVANIGCALFGAVPGSSSFARSAVNYQSGASTQLASMMSSFVVLVVLLFITPIFNYIPVAALAAHLIRVGIKMINTHQIKIACRSTRSDLAVFLVTFISCLIFKLDTAIYFGIGVSLALFLQQTSTPTLVEYMIDEGGALSELEDPSKRPDNQISIIHVEGELFFGAADLFQEQVRRLADDQNIRVFILRMKNARHLDASTVMAMETLHDYLRRTGRYLIISGSNPDVTKVLRRSGLLEQIGEENLFPAQQNSTAATRLALIRAKELLPNKDSEVRIFYDRPQEADMV